MWHNCCLPKPSGQEKSKENNMGVFDIGFVAVVGAFAYAFYEQHTKTKVKLANANQNTDDVRAQLEQLKQRIATLEAIVTDKSYTLKDEINRL